MNCGERYDDRFIFTVMYTADVAVELKYKNIQPSGDSNPWPLRSGETLYQLSCQAKWERGYVVRI